MLCYAVLCYTIIYYTSHRLLRNGPLAPKLLSLRPRPTPGHLPDCNGSYNSNNYWNSYCNSNSYWNSYCNSNSFGIAIVIAVVIDINDSY